MYKRDIYLDIDDNLNNYIKSVELDSNSRVWHFHLTVDYEPLDLTGKSVQFRAEKPDKTNVLNDCKIVDAEKGVVEVKLTRQVNAIPGHVKCLLKIIGDEGFVLKTKTFVVDVSKTLSDDAIVSSDEFGALEAALGKVQDIDNRFAQTNAQLSDIKEHCTGGNGMQEHSHTNKTTIDKLSENNGALQFNGANVSVSINDSDESSYEVWSSQRVVKEINEKGHSHGNAKVLSGFKDDNGLLSYNGVKLVEGEIIEKNKNIEIPLENTYILDGNIVDGSYNVSYSFADVDGVENEAYNTDTFESPETTYWQAYKGTKELVSQAHVKYTQTGSSGLFQTQLQVLHTSSNKFYIKWKARSTNAVTFHSSTNQKAFVSDGKWHLMGKIMDGISTGTAIFRAEPSTNGYVEIKDFMLIDLTKKYGSGNEPTFEECENMFGDVWVPRDSGGTDLDKNFIIKSYDESNQLLGKFDSSENSSNVKVVGGGKFVITYADVKPNYIRLDNVKYREIVKESADLGVNVVSLHNVDRLLFVGDSYTEGIYYIKGKSWTSLLSEQLDYTCDGYGWGGNTCEQIANRIIGNEARYSPLGYQDLKPTRAMLMSFVNDMAQNSQYSHIYQQGMQKLVEAVRQYGAEPIVCTEFRNPWGEGLQSGMSAYCDANNVRFWNILPYTSFLNNKTASDGADDRFWAGSHPGSRTGYIILDNYLRYCRTLPRPNSAIKIYRAKPTVTVNSLNDLHFTSLRDKLTKFKEIYISHSSLVNSAQWDSVTTNDGVQNPVISEYAKLMNGENINLGDYALVEVVVPTTSNNVSSAKLLLSDDSVEIYAKTTSSFTLLSNGEIAKSNGYVEYDKMTFLLHKEGGIILNDVRLEWVGQEVKKSLPLPHTINKKGIELLPNNKVDDTSWLTKYGTIIPKVPSDNVLPTGCTKCIEVNDKNYVEITSPNNNVVGTVQKNKLRVACRYNPTVGSSDVNENSYDYKELEIKFYGCNSGGKTRTYYTVKKDVGLHWTLVEVEFESNVDQKIIIKSPDTTNIEVAYISILEIL